MKSSESIVTQAQKSCLSFMAQEHLLNCLFNLCNPSVRSCCSQSFRSVTLTKQSQFLAVFIDPLKCSLVLTVKAHFLEDQLSFLQFTATPGFRLHNKAFCGDSLKYIMLVIRLRCLSFRMCSQPPIDFAA